MVQRKVPNKLGIKHLITDHTQMVNSTRSFPQTHDKPNKIMKKSRPVNDLPLRKKTTPNYMKSTSSFEARKEASPKTPSPLKSLKTHQELASGHKGSGLKLTKTPTFKPLRPAKKVILATCSSTLKQSKFPADYLELSPEGTSAMKVCPYTYCSLNGHHHAPLPSLKCYMSAGRRALKTHKSFKLGCLSPRQTKPPVNKNDKIVREQVHSKDEDGKNSSPDLKCSEIDWEEGYCSDLCNHDEQTFKLQEIDDQIGKTEDENLHSEFQKLYDEESVSSGAWTEENGDSESDSSSKQQSEDQDFVNYDATDVSLVTTEADVKDKTDYLESLTFSIKDQKNIECCIDYKQEKTYQESKTDPDFAEKSKEETDTHHTTIIYNIINFNISIFFKGEKTENGKSVTVKVPATANEESEKVSEEDGEPKYENHMVTDEQLPFDDQDIVSNQHLNASYLTTETDKEPASEKEEEITSEIDIKKNKTTSFCKKSIYNEEQQDPCRRLTHCKKLDQDMDYDDSQEFNPRGPNFLPEVVNPDAETVDLKHQDIDERKNAEEWMVDYALQQAVNTIAPKRKVSLLVKAFEKVMPISNYETPRNRNTLKAFTNARPMQACS